MTAALSHAALTLTFALMMKLHKTDDELDHADHLMSMYTYGLLVEGRNHEVVSFTDWAEPHWRSAGSRLSANVNSWLARKRLKGLDAIKSEVENWDTTSLAKEYRLVQLALLDLTEEGYGLAARLIASEDLGLGDC